MNRKLAQSSPLRRFGNFERRSLRGFTLLEVLVASILLALIVAGFANVFVAGKYYIMHSQHKITAVQLAKNLIEPLQSYVNYSQFNDTAGDYSGNNKLKKDSTPHNFTDETNPIWMNNFAYNASYIVTNITDFPPSSNFRSVTVNITWDEK